MQDRPINWAILGLGRIAHKFADDLRLAPGARLHAVASNSYERAREFAANYGAPQAFGSYEELLECPGIDIVYVATPHVGHYDATLRCLEKGLAVLCEKPLAMNARQVGAMVEAARSRKVFLMEAMWMRFIPAVAEVLERVGRGELGQLQLVTANFGFRSNFEPEARLFNKALGGGALLDIGIYPLALALLLQGRPTAVQASAIMGPTGVDETTAFTLRFGDDRMALGHATLMAHTPTDAHLYGSAGEIHLHPRFHHTSRVSFSQSPTDLERPYEGWGYHFEAVHVMDCLRAGRTESPLLPLDFSLVLMETLDAIRAEIGLHYESDR